MTQRNVLYLLLDDARTGIGAYGHDGPAQGGAHTPHLDALAEGSIVFEQAYCQIALCLPSRNSFLTGRSPNTTRVNNLLWGTPPSTLPNFRLNAGGQGWTTLPQHFKNAGYNVAGMGKVYHDKGSVLTGEWSWALGNMDDAMYSWSADFPYLEKTTKFSCPDDDVWCEVSAADEEKLADHEITSFALQRLDELAARPEPWFMVVGLKKPHVSRSHNAAPDANPSTLYPRALRLGSQRLCRVWLRQSPYNAPATWYADYPLDEITSPAHPAYSGSDEYSGSGLGRPEVTYFEWETCSATKKQYTLDAHAPIPDAGARAMRRAYHACMAFADDNLGKVLARLDAKALAPTTLVVFHSDHGYRAPPAACRLWRLKPRLRDQQTTAWGLNKPVRDQHRHA